MDGLRELFSGSDLEAVGIALAEGIFNRGSSSAHVASAAPAFDNLGRRALYPVHVGTNTVGVTLSING